jgi:hypothetical protein
LIRWSRSDTCKTNQLRWSSFACSPLGNQNTIAAATESVVLSGTIPHLEFTLEMQSNNLTYQGNPYTEYQQFLYTLIKSLHDKGYGYRRIAHKLNKWEVATPRGKKWFNTSVSSVLKRKHERDTRIQEIRNKEYPIKIGKFAIKYYTF